MGSLQKVDREDLDSIERFDRAACLDHWRSTFGRPPPKRLSVQFMRRVLIWDAQCEAHGSLCRKSERRLAEIASGKASAIAKPGSQLVREWNGRVYQVEVVKAGYVMDGKTWRSLSAIARHITGARWSGPRFFGLR